MDYRNKFNLHPVWLHWLGVDNYDYEENVWSITALMGPVKSTILTKRHWDSIIIDISERIALRIGDAFHDSMEAAAIPGIRRTVDRAVAHGRSGAGPQSCRPNCPWDARDDDQLFEHGIASTTGGIGSSWTRVRL